MTQVVINDVEPRTQLVATAGQTVFNTNWTVNATTDVNVYARATGVPANDVTQLVSPTLYTVTLVGGSQTVVVTFNSGRSLNDVITIVRATPNERENLYINTNFLPSMLNNDFGILTLIDQQNEMYDTRICPHYNVSATIEPIIDEIIPILGANQVWAKDPTNTFIMAYNVPSSGGIATNDATFITQTDETSDLPNSQPLSALGTGFVTSATGTGILTSVVLQPTANQINILNPNGISNPVFSLSSTLNLPGTLQIQGTTAVNQIINDSTLSSATSMNLATAGSIKAYVDAAVHGFIDTITGTPNQINVSTPSGNPTLSLSSTLNLPGTFAIQGSQAVNTISTDGTFASPSNSQLVTALAVQTYVAANHNLPGGNSGTMQWNNAGVFAGDTGTTTDGSGNVVIGSSLTVADFLLTGNDIRNTLDPTTKLTFGTGTLNFLMTGSSIMDLSTSGIRMGGANARVTTILTDNTFSAASDTVLYTGLAIKNYVNSVAQGFNFKNAVVAASTGTNLTATYNNGTAGVGATLTNSGTQVAFALDGISLSSSQRVLIKDQTSSFQNGIYSVTTVGDGSHNWVLTRTTDYNTTSEIIPGTIIPVNTGGTVNGGTSWLETATVNTIGTDPIVFIQFTAALPIGVPEGGTGRTSVTAYALLAGGTTSTGTLQIVPTSTSGYLLQSGGSAALPSFTNTPALGTPASGVMTNVSGLPLTTGVTGILPVANGGSGLATLTTYGIMTAGTTATGVMQQVVNGTSGWLLQSGGAAGLPTFTGTPALGTPASGVMTNVTGLPLTTGVTGILPIANGGTNSGSVVIAPTATSWAGWDANKNMSANNFIPGITSTASSGGTTVLTVGSTYQQYITGTMTHTFTMPVASTLVAGQPWMFVNNSTGAVTVQSSGSNAITTIPGGTSSLITCTTASGTSATSWNADGFGNTAGVSSITGTANQVIASASTGAITLSLPQSIATSSAVQFGSLQLSNTGLLDANGNTMEKFSATGSAVNYFLFTNSATGNAISLAAGGSDSNIDMNLSGKGTGGVPIAGRTDAAAAATGKVGEIITATQAARTTGLTDNNTATAVSITLTPGAWMVTGWLVFSGNNSTTVSLTEGGLTTGSSLPTERTQITSNSAAYSGLGSISFAVPTLPFNVSSNTTLNLVGQSTFATSTSGIGGTIRAYRIF